MASFPDPPPVAPIMVTASRRPARHKPARPATSLASLATLVSLGVVLIGLVVPWGSSFNQPYIAGFHGGLGQIIGAIAVLGLLIQLTTGGRGRWGVASLGAMLVVLSLLAMLAMAWIGVSTAHETLTLKNDVTPGYGPAVCLLGSLATIAFGLAQPSGK